MNLSPCHRNHILDCSIHQCNVIFLCLLLLFQTHRQNSEGVYGLSFSASLLGPGGPNLRYVQGKHAFFAHEIWGGVLFIYSLFFM